MIDDCKSFLEFSGITCVSKSLTRTIDAGTNPHVSHAVRRRGRSGEGGDGGAGAGAAPMSSAQGPMSEHVDAAAGPGVYNGDHDFKEGHLSPGHLKNVEVDVSQQPAGHETDFKSLREHAKRV